MTQTMTLPAVTLYTKERCVQCTGTKRKLDKEGVVYETVDLSAAYMTPKELLASSVTPEEIEEARRSVEAIKELGHLQMPVVIVSRPGEDDVHWSGNIPANIMQHCLPAVA